MQLSEYLLLKETFKNKKTFLEFGSGGSTIFLLKNRKKVFSVESNKQFYNYMRSINLVKKSLGSNLDYKLIDLGATNIWGKPIEAESEVTWSNYYCEVWEHITSKDNIDVIFIDGRFRICCCLYSILKVLEYNWNDTVFVIHDFWRRKKYHIILKFLDEIKSSKDLATFRVKDNINIEEVRQMIDESALVTA
jgi:hypothetical protein